MGRSDERTFAQQRTVSDLPRQTGAELRSVLAETERTQANLQAMLEEARAALREARDGLAEAHDVVEQASLAAGEIAASGQSWHGAAAEVRGLLAEYRAYSDATADEESSAGDYALMADRITVAAGEVRALLADLRDEPEGASELMLVVSRAEGLIDRVFAWAVGLVVLLFALQVVLVLLRRTSGPSPRLQDPAKPEA